MEDWQGNVKTTAHKVQSVLSIDFKVLDENCYIFLLQEISSKTIKSTIVEIFMKFLFCSAQFIQQLKCS